MGTTLAYSGEAQDFANGTYGQILYGSGSNQHSTIRETDAGGGSLDKNDFSDWQIGVYTFTAGSEAHNSAIRVSTLWVEVAWEEPQAAGRSFGYIIG